MNQYEINLWFDVMHFFMYGLFATLPCLLAYLHVRFLRGKWGLYKAYLIWWMIVFLGGLMRLKRRPDIYHVWYFIGEEFFRVLFLWLYWRLIKGTIQKREEAKGEPRPAE